MGNARLKQDLAILRQFLKRLFPRHFKLIWLKSVALYLLGMLLLLLLFIPAMSHLEQQKQQQWLELSQQVLALKPNQLQLQQFFQFLPHIQSASWRAPDAAFIHYGKTENWSLFSDFSQIESLKLLKKEGFFYSFYQNKQGNQVYLKIYPERYYANKVQNLGIIFILIFISIYIIRNLYQQYKRYLQHSISELSASMASMQNKSHIDILDRNQYQHLAVLVDKINCLIKRYKKQLSPINSLVLETQYKMAKTLEQRETKLQQNLDDSYLYLQQILDYIPADKKNKIQTLRQQNRENKQISQNWQQFFQLEQSYLYHNEYIFNLEKLQNQLILIYTDHYTQNKLVISEDDHLPNNYLTSGNPYQIRFMLRQLLQDSLKNTQTGQMLSWHSSITAGNYQFRIYSKRLPIRASAETFKSYIYDKKGYFKHQMLGITKRLAQQYHGDLEIIKHDNAQFGFNLQLHLPLVETGKANTSLNCWQLNPTQSYHALILTDEPVHVLSLQQRLYYLGFSRVLVQGHYQNHPLPDPKPNIIFTDSISNLRLDLQQNFCPRILIKHWSVEQTCKNYGFKMILLPPFKLEDIQACLEQYLDADFLPCSTKKVQNLYSLMANTPLPHLNSCAYHNFCEAIEQEDIEVLHNFIKQISIVKWKKALQDDLEQKDFSALKHKMKYIYLD